MSLESQVVEEVSRNELVISQAITQREHKFVSGISLNRKDAARIRREVRSHVAKVSAHHANDDDSTPSGKSKPRKRRAKALIWTIQLDLDSAQEDPVPTAPKAFPRNSSAVPAIESVMAQLPFVPLLIDNYIDKLAVAVPELDGPGNTFLLRSTWFPMVIHHPVLFQVIMLFSASHYAAARKDMSMASEILLLKQMAITGLRDAMFKAEGNFRDDVIASAAKLASYEAIYGSQSTFHTHMSGVANMVKDRGGLEALGLNGFLARLLLFIDTNSAFLLNSKVHLDESMFPKQANQFLPNPGHFIGHS